ncbi:FAD-dependent oxidoreductase [Ruminococcaceae bacterium OttesenSCG-928-D13]|nr:FAD-dependent oxidoreductase [Ruminococcaceae bacterium OttesenSCG-928-D13]
MLKLTIDGRTVTAAPGSTVLQAALDGGIYIPHLCDHENLRHTANCRLCMVKVEGMEGVQASCATPAEDGMVVNTKDALAEKVRRLSVDLMFKTHPNDCTGCPKYGRCQLQSIQQAVGDTGRALRTNPIRLPADDKNPILLHEMYRCVLCGRCVRACGELRGVGAINFEKVDGRVQVKVQGESLEKADCRFCGACIEVCPTGAIREHEEITKRMEGRTREAALVPCSEGCPGHIDIPKYLRYIREENYPAAVAVIREKAPFPHALGYICTHNCESECRRGFINQAVAIRDLKRYACERDDGSWKKNSVQKPATGKLVGVVGAGPAGLTAAYYLARQGHAVTVFEAQDKPGGMMRYGIPGYRLPRNVVDGEIEEIVSAGVELRCGEPVDSAQALLDKGFDAVLVAVGAHAGVRLPIAGNAFENVYVNTEFLRANEQGAPMPVGERVVVLGGGNVAMDCVGIARRLGAKQIQLACLEAADAMTASPEEIEWAVEEGLVIHNAKTFLEITGSDRATGVRIATVESFYFDEEGKSCIELVPDSETVLEADTVIFATGQRPGLDAAFGLELGRGNRVVVDGSGAASLPGVYAAGDAVTGTDSVIRAIANGRDAASSIDLYLGGDGVVDEKLSPDQFPDPCIGAIDGFGALDRAEANVVPAEKRVCGFELMDLGYDEGQSLCEAGRCLQCDLRLQIAPQKFWSDYEKGEASGE